jgi:hypothetical protein
MGSTLTCTAPAVSAIPHKGLPNKGSLFYQDDVLAGKFAGGNTEGTLANGLVELRADVALAGDLSAELSALKEQIIHGQVQTAPAEGSVVVTKQVADIGTASNPITLIFLPGSDRSISIPPLKPSDEAPWTYGDDPDISPNLLDSCTPREVDGLQQLMCGAWQVLDARSTVID